jgi:hypothetical protein
VSFLLSFAKATCGAQHPLWHDDQPGTAAATPRCRSSAPAVWTPAHALCCCRSGTPAGASAPAAGRASLSSRHRPGPPRLGRRGGPAHHPATVALGCRALTGISPHWNPPGHSETTTPRQSAANRQHQHAEWDRMTRGVTNCPAMIPSAVLEPPHIRVDPHTDGVPRPPTDSPLHGKGLALKCEWRDCQALSLVGSGRYLECLFPSHGPGRSGRSGMSVELAIP